MRILASAAVLLIAIGAGNATVFAAGSGGCPDGYYKTGETTEETADAIIVHPLCKRIRHPAAEVYAERFCKEKSYADADIRALKELDFKTDLAQFEQYEDLSREQRNVFIYKALMAEVDQAIEAGKMAAKAAKPLNPYSVNAAIKKLKRQKWIKTAEAHGLNTERIFSTVRQIANVKDKPARVAAYKNFIKEATAFRTGAETGYGMAKEPDTAGPQLVLGLLKLVEVSPEAALAITSADFLESAGWYYSLKTSINQQMDVTDEKLVQLGKLQKSLETHVPKLKAARAAWSKVAHKSGEPVCHS